MKRKKEPPRRSSGKADKITDSKQTYTTVS